MADQTTLGHRFIASQFSKAALPTVQWQIDPFGHSSTHAALLSAAVGYDSLFFERIDHQDYDIRTKNKTMETVWRASASLGGSFEVFTGAFLDFGYGPPPGFSWDACQDSSPLNGDPRLHSNNVKERVDDFVTQVNAMAAKGQGHGDVNDIMILMGSDFQWSNGLNYFRNVDALIEAVNKDGRVRAFYSTPADYVAAKHKYGISWQRKTDDYFPYADCDHCYWTGYFVSRPALKRYVRTTSSAFTAYRQIAAVAGVSSSAMEALAEALGVAQHHDAVSGTAKQHVAFDYAMRLSDGAAEAAPVVSSSLDRLAVPSTAAGAATAAGQSAFEECPLLNVSVCPAAQAAGGFEVLVWNPLGQPVRAPLSIPVPSEHWVVDGVAQTTVPSEASFSNYAPLSGGSPYTLRWMAALPPVGFRTFSIKPVTAARVARVSASRTVAAETVISNGDVSVRFNADGQMQQVISGDTDVPVQQTWGAYTSYWRMKNKDGQNSGAYIFRPWPNGTETPCGEMFCGLGKPTRATLVRDSTGKVVGMDTEWQGLNGPAAWVRQRVSVPPSGAYVDMSYTVGPVPDHPLGLEVVTKLSTGLSSRGVWYTDSNGREFIERRRNVRFSWPLNVTEPIAGNYYPMNAGAWLGDGRTALAALTDASVGATSLVDGELEMMVHRRVMHDDSRGVGEPHNETEIITPYNSDRAQFDCQGCHRGRPLIVRGALRLVVAKQEKLAAAFRPQMDALYGTPRLFFRKPASSASAMVKQWGALTQPLPRNVNLMTLERLDAPGAPKVLWERADAAADALRRGEFPGAAGGSGGVVLVRLAHQYSVGEDATLSAPVSVDLASLFPNTTLPWETATEHTLTAQWPISRMRDRLTWTSHTGPYAPPPLPAAMSAGRVAPHGALAPNHADTDEYRDERLRGDAVITLHPMEVRTFILQ
eukprot:TRINITY_DN424_c0_g2_i1.p1 TRINITY_DN424_c0_g2~~TRINITY_DN424_c0_g2_i1.p1  ORF type:complete len:1077 (+),score=263.14 TRINITY_DN424_c0_g2_i1:448-3231(+)